jgi:hypothetical protein
VVGVRGGGAQHLLAHLGDELRPARPQDAGEGRAGVPAEGVALAHLPDRPLLGRVGVRRRHALDLAPPGGPVGDAPVGEVGHRQPRHPGQGVGLVRQPGERRAGLGEEALRLLGPLLVVDVGAGPEPAQDPAVRAAQRQGPADVPAVGAVGPAEPGLILERRVRRAGVATFRGQLVGRPFPPRGVTLDLQIFQPHVGWRVFGNTRTRKDGRFRIRYHFQPATRGRFTFRMRLRPNDAYPYTRGFSGRMRVRVG